MKTVALDFDGVIHRYGEGYKSGTPYDEPMEGAFDTISQLLQHFCVFIHSARDPAHIERWLTEHNAPWPFRIIHLEEQEPPFWNVKGVVGITNRKLAALAYIDDHAVRFESPKQWPDIIHSLVFPAL